MPSTSAKVPGALTSVSHGGHPSQAVWGSTLANIQTSNNVYVTATMSAGDTTESLKASTFAMAIPLNSVVTGIEVAIECKDSNGTTWAVSLMKSNTDVGVAKNISPGSSDTVSTLGGASDLWGTTWSISDVNATGFGVYIIANTAHAVAAVAAIDFLTVKVYYSAPFAQAIVIA